jgi:thymidylate synthase
MIIHGDQKTIDDFKYEDFELVDYDPWPAIKAEVSV